MKSQHGPCWRPAWPCHLIPSEIHPHHLDTPWRGGWRRRGRRWRLPRAPARPQGRGRGPDSCAGSRCPSERAVPRTPGGSGTWQWAGGRKGGSVAWGSRTKLRPDGTLYSLEQSPAHRMQQRAPRGTARLASDDCRGGRRHPGFPGPTMRRQALQRKRSPRRRPAATLTSPRRPAPSLTWRWSPRPATRGPAPPRCLQEGADRR